MDANEAQNRKKHKSPNVIDAPLNLQLHCFDWLGHHYDGNSGYFLAREERAVVESNKDVWLRHRLRWDWTVHKNMEKMEFAKNEKTTNNFSIFRGSQRLEKKTFSPLFAMLGALSPTEVKYVIDIGL